MSRGEERWPGLRRVFRLPLGQRGVARDVDEELRFHLEERIEELLAGGMPRAQAEAEVRHRFGDMGRIGAELASIDRGTERHRARAEWLGDLGRDMRYAVRGMRARPLVATIIIVTLALGIGANTAIFSVVYSVLLRPLPYAHADRLIQLRERNGPKDTQGMVVTAGNLATWEQRARGFAMFGAYTYGGFTLTGVGNAQSVSALRASASYWKTLYIPPVLGRYFNASEDRAGAPHVVVLSHAFWESTFGGDPHVLGRALTLSGTPYTVIGVAPAAYELGLQARDLWVPLALPPSALTNHGDHELTVVGMLREGVSQEQAVADLTRIEMALAARYPHSYFDGHIIATPLRDWVVGSVRPLLLILLGAVGLVLLIACANVTSLLLARAASREKEMAIRRALGAGGGRLVTQMLAESLLLAIVGAVVGLGVAWAGVRFLVMRSPLGGPRLHGAAINGPVLAFTAGLAVLCGIIFGVYPALGAARVALQQTLREGWRESGGVVRVRFRAALVVGEVALALVLLVGAGLLVRSAIRLQHVPPGFDPHNLLVVRTGGMPEVRYPSDASVLDAYRRINTAVAALPGVRSAALVNLIPIGTSGTDCSVRPEGTAPDEGSTVVANYRSATGNYFATMGIPLLAGRTFTDADAADAPGVVVINRDLGHRLFGDANPVGKRVHPCGDTTSAGLEVVGVIGDVRANGLDAPIRDEMYFPNTQLVRRGMTLVVRGDVRAATLTPAIRRIVARADPLLAVSAITMDDIIGRTLAPSRFSSTLLLLLGATGLTLAVVGIYGVIAYLVAQRTREIGIRMALGADSRRVLAMVVREGLVLAALGVAIGLAVAWVATRWLASLLYGVSAHDPLSFAVAGAILLLVALAASWVPARRATQVDPTLALRSE
ncbi:MAG TPA: ABC transporter permease [Gemmatimonadaceae bacterium]|nr:ABC transporter permease [Gemmatimonadaceae bacterium]